jgi:hypothetical protein
MLIDSIIDYRNDENAVTKDDEYVVVNGKRSHQKLPMDGNSIFNGRMEQQVGSHSGH